MRTVIPIKQVNEDELRKDPEGWEPRGILAEPRLSEMADFYRELGYEVEIRGLQRSEDECSVCFEEGGKVGQIFGTIFIRRTTSPSQDDDSLG